MTGRRPGRLAGLLLIGSLALTGRPHPLLAQQDSLVHHGAPFVVHYGKWVALAAAIGMGIKASQAHHAADRAFDRLNSFCEASQFNCIKLADGRYANPTAEGYYQASVRNDNHARGWILGGELSLVGAVGMFIWELSRPRAEPKNIPFEPEMQWTPEVTRIGGRVRF